VHEPARLAILTVLSACERADFVFLERATGLTAGNVSVQLSRLEKAGLIEVEKTIMHRKTVTTAALLGRGRGALASYWEQMAELRARSVAPKKAVVRRPRGATGTPAVAGGKA
jgi:DNA-binding transcriptional ArsR family regulator